MNLDSYTNKRNTDVLFGIVKQNIHHGYQVELPDNNKRKIVEIMKFVYNANPNQKGLSTKEYRQILNKKVLDKAIGYFQHVVEKQMKPIRPSLTGPNPKLDYQEFRKQSVQGVYDQFQQQREHEMLAQKPSSTPNFEEPVQDSKEDLSGLYERIEHLRTHTDIISPPRQPEGVVSREPQVYQSQPRPLTSEEENFSTSIQEVRHRADDNLKVVKPVFHPDTLSKMDPDKREIYLARQQKQQCQKKQPHDSFAIWNYGEAEETEEDFDSEPEPVVEYKQTAKEYYQQNEPKTSLEQLYQRKEASQYLDPDNNYHRQYNVPPVAPPAPEGAKLIIPRFSRNLTDDFYNQHIPRILVIDSRDRNHDKYPNPYDYRVDLNDTFRDIISMELIGSEIPNSYYNINSSNNLIHFREDPGIILTATIPPGNYSLTSLKAAIETAMDAAGDAAISYTVTFDTISFKTTITSDAVGPKIFDLVFFGGTEPFGEIGERTIYRSRSMAKVLGYDREDLTGSLSYTSVFTFNLSNEKYVLLHIPDFEHIDGPDSDVRKSYAKLQLDSSFGDTSHYKRADTRFIKYFSPPLGKLGTLRIQFKTYDGNFFDFNGQEHSLTFRIELLDSTKLKTTNEMQH